MPQKMPPQLARRILPAVMRHGLGPEILGKPGLLIIVLQKAGIGQFQKILPVAKLPCKERPVREFHTFPCQRFHRLHPP